MSADTTGQNPTQSTDMTPADALYFDALQAVEALEAVCVAAIPQTNTPGLFQAIRHIAHSLEVSAKQYASEAVSSNSKPSGHRLITSELISGIDAIDLGKCYAENLKAVFEGIRGVAENSETVKRLAATGIELAETGLQDIGDNAAPFYSAFEEWRREHDQK
jgi:hypothetical protein